MTHKAGYVNIIGRPNVGKSTLMNQLVGEKISIITSKAQTTRHRILGIVNGDDFQIVFSDTPGIIKDPAYKMHEVMNQFVNVALIDADLILFVVDITDKKVEEKTVERLKTTDTPVFVLINKIDLSTQEQVEQAVQQWRETLLISARKITIFFPKKSLFPQKNLQPFQKKHYICTKQTNKPMKKHFLTLLALAFLMSIAVAQPAMMTKGQVGNSTQVDTTLTCQESLNNRLDVEIVSEYGERFHHPQHPEIGQTCPFIVWFTTNHQYAWYQWETTLPNWEMWNDYVFHSDVFSSGYIKVTVGDNYGNTGTDSIWFNVKDHVSPLGSFIMELGDDLYPTFSGIATPEHYRIFIGRGFTPGQSIHHENFFLSPGEWVYKDVNAIYNEDTLWIYNIMILDTCMLNYLYKRYLVSMASIRLEMPSKTEPKSFMP